MDRKPHTSFPTTVAWLSLGVSVLLFCGNTVPALRERADLQATQQQVERLRQQFERTLANSRAATPEAAEEIDIQSLLVAIDRIGLTPIELLQANPQ